MNGREKVGVGIITYNRQEYFKQCISKMPWSEIDECIVVKDGGGEDYSIKEPTNFYYHTFEDNGGVSRSKNKAINYLLEKKCKHLFIIEDDMLIKDSNVFKRYIKAAYRTGIYHMMFLKVADNRLHKRVTIDGIDLHRNPQGSFMYILDGVARHVGDLDIEFKNAFEHIDWTYRAIQKGLMPPFWWFPDIENSQELIEEIPGSSENSSITDTEGYDHNWQKSAQHWVDKYGFFTNKIKDSSYDQVVQRLKFLKKNYSKQ